MGTISGHVISENGQSLPNATVYLRGSVSLFPPRITTTDSQGNFEVTNLDPAFYSIAVTAPGYVSPPRDPDVPATYYRIGDSVTLNMVKGGEISGTVLSSSGDPLVQVVVQAALIRDETGQRPKYSAYQSQKLTDDRGVYRIYGLLPGTYVVSAGGRGSSNAFANPYITDAPTYAPSSTRDTASEISVRAGEERSGVDIRYRGEPGYIVSGVVSGPTEPNSTVSVNINLMQISNGVPQNTTYSFQPPNSKGFSFYGVGDGDYVLTAQSYLVPGEIVASDPRPITVKGADVNGLEITMRPLAAISGHVSLEASDAAECKNKRQPLFSETLVTVRRNEKNVLKDQVRPFGFPLGQASPNKSGDFTVRNLTPGEYSLNARYAAKYWYLRSITQNENSTQSVTGKGGPTARQADVVRNWIPLKFGERVNGITVTLTEGAASLVGTIKAGEGERIPPKFYIHLVPAEKENSEDAFRFFVGKVDSNGAFALHNVGPGRYWVLAQVAVNDDIYSDSNLRGPGALQTRAMIRRQAELAHTAIQFKPCQNLVDYQLPLVNSPVKN